MSQATQQLWQRLERSGLVEGPEPPASSPLSPWYVRLMLGLAGWVGALFLLGFFAVGLSFVIESTAGSLIAGVLITGVAVGLFKSFDNNDFVGQFAFAFSLAGQALLFIGLAQWLDNHTAQVAAAGLLIGAALFWLVEPFLHRFWSALVIVTSAAFLLGSVGLAPLLVAFGTAGFTAVWLNDGRLSSHCTVTPALAYALTTGTLIATFSHKVFGLSWWLNWQPAIFEPATMAWISAAIIATTVWAAGRHLMKRDLPVKALSHDLVLLAVALASGLVSVRADGIVVTTLLIVLAHAIGHWPLLGLALLSLLAYLSSYYYLLELTLLTKSLLLIGTGLALLAARALSRVMRRPQADRT